MSEKKPFAVALGNGTTVRFGEAPDEYDLALNVEAHSFGHREAAAALNEAVEARSTRWKGRNHALRMIAAELGDAAGQVLGRPITFNTSDRLYRAVHAFREHMLSELDDEDEYISGHVACGLAFDLGVWTETVRDMARVVEALSEPDRKLVGPVLRGMGLHEEEPLEVTCDRLRGALRETINLVARNGGSSTPEFRAAVAVYDSTDRANMKMLLVGTPKALMFRHEYLGVWPEFEPLGDGEQRSVTVVDEVGPFPSLDLAEVERCYSRHGVQPCTRPRGHRGRHEAASGNRW